MAEVPPPAARTETGFSRRPPAEPRPFFGLIDAVIVPGTAGFDFDGAILERHAQGVWVWMVRDIAHDLIRDDLTDSDDGRAELDKLMPALMQRAREATTNLTVEAERRVRVQMGGDDTYRRLPFVLQALKCRALYDKAGAFGRATAGMADEAALGLALQSMPLNDRAVCALLMQAAVGEVANPGKVMAAAIRIAGSSEEQAVARAGFSTLVDAMLSHAQAQIPALQQYGAFADIDRVCTSVERFHKLIRAVTSYMELGRLTRWSSVVAALIKTVSELLEPKLREVLPDVNLALRRHHGTDWLDTDQVLAALNGCYILNTVRDCRDSLALNALFDQMWTQVGQALDIHVNRNLELFRQNPSDRVTGERLDAAIKMAELRFNSEYADVLRRARDGAERRAG
ncbi:MAG: hypothetical protein ACO1OG_02285 [Devosia sp.]